MVGVSLTVQQALDERRRAEVLAPHDANQHQEVGRDAEHERRDQRPQQREHRDCAKVAEEVALRVR